MIKCATMCATKSTQVEIGDAFNSVKIIERYQVQDTKMKLSAKYSNTFT